MFFNDMFEFASFSGKAVIPIVAAHARGLTLLTFAVATGDDVVAVDGDECVSGDGDHNIMWTMMSE